MSSIKYNMEWAASRVFMDEHFGKALTAEDFRICIETEEFYAEEINYAKEVIKELPEFQLLSLEEKIDITKRMLIQLKEVNENKRLQKIQ